MDAQRKKEFIAELMNSVQGDLIRQVDRLPETWDGHELRQWVSDRFYAQTSSVFHDKRSQRRKEYENFILTSGL